MKSNFDDPKLSSYYAFMAMNKYANGADKISRDALKDISSLKQIQQWLHEQLKQNAVQANGLLTKKNQHWTSVQAIVGYASFMRQQKSAQTNKQDMTNITDMRKRMVADARKQAELNALAGINNARPLQAKLLDFFSNHFSVSRQNLAMLLLSPTLETEAIAGHLHLRFSDMLVAVTQHPAMLLYLNNERSIGPNSKLALNRKAKKRKQLGGLNENLAREILELHTLGVNSGYTQSDVVELAKSLTGWSVGNVRQQEPAGFVFRANSHEPESRTVLGKQYPQQINKDQRGANQAQGLAILHDLANHPATASHLSHKLATHFLSDTPPVSVVKSMTQAWFNTQGNIPSVMAALINHDDSWQLTAENNSTHKTDAHLKFKTPREFVISSCRACGQNKPKPSLYKTLEVLGHGLFNAGSPAGYPDLQSAWLGTSALNSRIEWASHFAANLVKQNNIDPITIARNALGPLLSPTSANAIARAESKHQALTLFLMSPEFQRR